MKCALFDLDGTLTDSAEGIIKSILYALDKMEWDVPPMDILRLFIGPPLIESFVEHCGMTNEESKKAYAFFQERYLTIGKFENMVYPGILEMLAQCHEQGIFLAVATAKPEVSARQILEHFGLAPYFSVIKGAHNERGLIHKEDILNEALQECYAAQDKVETFYMVGDRLYDMEAAVELGCYPIGVTYGFGSREELLAAGAKVLCDTAAEVGKVIVGDVALLAK